MSLSARLLSVTRIRSGMPCDGQPVPVASGGRLLSRLLARCLLYQAADPFRLESAELDLQSEKTSACAAARDGFAAGRPSASTCGTRSRTTSGSILSAAELTLSLAGCWPGIARRTSAPDVGYLPHMPRSVTTARTGCHGGLSEFVPVDEVDAATVRSHTQREIPRIRYRRSGVARAAGDACGRPRNAEYKRP